MFHGNPHTGALVLASHTVIHGHLEEMALWIEEQGIKKPRPTLVAEIPSRSQHAFSLLHVLTNSLPPSLLSWTQVLPRISRIISVQLLANGM